MYHPTSRVLAVLELLQSKPLITGLELAAVLEVDVRTVRRYITILQDVGIPVEATLVGMEGIGSALALNCRHCCLRKRKLRRLCWVCWEPRGLR